MQHPVMLSVWCPDIKATSFEHRPLEPGVVWERQAEAPKKGGSRQKRVCASSSHNSCHPSATYHALPCTVYRRSASPETFRVVQSLFYNSPAQPKHHLAQGCRTAAARKIFTTIYAVAPQSHLDAMPPIGTCSLCRHYASLAQDGSEKTIARGTRA